MFTIIRTEKKKKAIELANMGEKEGGGGGGGGLPNTYRYPSTFPPFPACSFMGLFSYKYASFLYKYVSFNIYSWQIVQISFNFSFLTQRPFSKETNFTIQQTQIQGEDKHSIHNKRDQLYFLEKQKKREEGKCPIRMGIL